MIAFGGAAAEKGQGALNAFYMDTSSCHFFGLDGMEDEGHAAYGLALDLGDDEGDSGECGEWVRASGAGVGGSSSCGTSGAAAERPLNHPPPPLPPPSPLPRAPLSPPPSPRSTSYARAMAARGALSMPSSPTSSEPSALLAPRSSPPPHPKRWTQSLRRKR